MRNDTHLQEAAKRGFFLDRQIRELSAELDGIKTTFRSNFEEGGEFSCEEGEVRISKAAPPQTKTDLVVDQARLAELTEGERGWLFQTGVLRYHTKNMGGRAGAVSFARSS